MSNTIDLEGVRRGKAHLKRAVELGKQRGARPARPVPLGEIIAGGAATLTVDELAMLTRLAAITIRRDIKSGRLKAANGGGKSAYRISRTDAEAWWRGRGGGALIGEPAAGEAPYLTNGNGAGNNGLARRLALLDSMTDDLPNDRAAAGLAPLTDDDIASSYDED